MKTTKNTGMLKHPVKTWTQCRMQIRPKVTAKWESTKVMSIDNASINTKLWFMGSVAFACQNLYRYNSNCVTSYCRLLRSVFRVALPGDILCSLYICQHKLVLCISKTDRDLPSTTRCHSTQHHCHTILRFNSTKIYKNTEWVFYNPSKYLLDHVLLSNEQSLHFHNSCQQNPPNSAQISCSCISASCASRSRRCRRSSASW